MKPCALKRMQCLRCGHTWDSPTAYTECIKCGHEYVRWLNYEEWKQRSEA